MKHTNFVLADAIKEINKYGELCPTTLKKLEEIKRENNLTVGDLKKSWILSLTEEQLNFLKFTLEDIMDVDSVDMKKERKEIRDDLLRKVKRMEELSNAAVEEK